MVAGNGQTTNFTYDFAGNLLLQNDSGPTSNLTRTFVLDEITDVAYWQNSDGNQFSVLSGRWIDSHLATVHSGGQIEYGLSDAINSTVATVDQAGALKGQFSYEPFGQTTASGSNYLFQYTGRVPVSTGLYYYRARFYNAATGRFISEDAIRFLRRDANLYRYARNAPTNFRDPYGRQASPGDGFTVDVSDQTPHGPYGDWPSWPPRELRPEPLRREEAVELMECLSLSFPFPACMPGRPHPDDAHGDEELSTGIPPLQRASCPNE
jgi:RHS repeat-associated protein